MEPHTKYLTMFFRFVGIVFIGWHLWGALTLVGTLVTATGQVRPPFTILQQFALYSNLIFGVMVYILAQYLAELITRNLD